MARDIFRDADVTMNYLHGHANIGYGAAHNLVMHGGNTHYHLVLNPDVELAPDALPSAFRFLGEHAEIGVLAPASRSGRRHARVCLQALSHGVRSCPARVRAARIEAAVSQARSTITRCATWSIASRRDETISPIPAMSGSFMFVRRKAIEATGGFDPRFFLYFEDFDWSVRLNRVTRTVYVPAVKIVHHGGGAAKRRRATSDISCAARHVFQQAWLEVAMTPQIGGKVLVTGAHGFIGRALCRHLAAMGVAHVRTVRAPAAGDAGRRRGRRRRPCRGRLGRSAGRRGLDRPSRRPCPRAGTARRGRSHALRGRQRARHAAACAMPRLRAKVRRIVLASSVKVYGESTRMGRPFRAGDPAAPRDAYAHSKAEAERVLWQACAGTRSKASCCACRSPMARESRAISWR